MDFYVSDFFKTELWYYILLLTSISLTIYVGTEIFSSLAVPLFLLPLSFSICLVLFKRIIQYHRNGYGLKVLYFIIVTRYLIIPTLTCLTKSYSSLTIYSNDAYYYGVIMQVIELITTCAVIYVYFPKTNASCSIKHLKEGGSYYYDELSFGGIIVVLFSVLLIYTRGIDNLLSSMRFFIVSSGLEEESKYGYDIWLAHTLLAFLMIVIAGTFQRKEEEKKQAINIIIPLVVAFFSCSLSFGDNRMTIVYYAISAYAILMIAFPRRKYVVNGTIIPTAIIVLASFTMIKQFSYDVTAGGDTGLEEDDIVSTMSAYVSTTQNIAKSYDMYSVHGDKMTVNHIISDVANGIVIFQLPVFQQLTSSFRKHPTSISLASTSTEVVPMAGQSLFYGGYFLGWFIDILFFVVLIRLLILTDCRSKLERRLGNKYLLTWISVTFGMIMTYNMSIIWNSLNATPLFTFGALWVNRAISLHKNKIRFSLG